MADPLRLLNTLFLNAFLEQPCEVDGPFNEGGNLEVHDWNGDGLVNISDGASGLNWIFNSKPPVSSPAHDGGEDCKRIPGCPNVCTPAP